MCFQHTGIASEYTPNRKEEHVCSRVTRCTFKAPRRNFPPLSSHPNPRSAMPWPRMPDNAVKRGMRPQHEEAEDTAAQREEEEETAADAIAADAERAAEREPDGGCNAGG